MSTVLWVILGLTAWAVVSLPLALVVGRALRRSARTPDPAPTEPTPPVLAA